MEAPQDKREKELAKEKESKKVGNCAACAVGLHSQMQALCPTGCRDKELAASKRRHQPAVEEAEGGGTDSSENCPEKCTFGHVHLSH